LRIKARGWTDLSLPPQYAEPVCLLIDQCFGRFQGTSWTVDGVTPTPPVYTMFGSYFDLTYSLWLPWVEDVTWP